HERQYNLLLIMLGLSLVAMIALVLWSVRSQKSMKEADQELSSELEINSSKEDASYSDVVSSAVKQADSDAYVSENRPTRQSSDSQPPQSVNVTSQPVVPQYSIQQVPEQAPVVEKHVA
ncbi:Hpt domain-containing protein, partial [Vibrio sp. 10N.222.48.A8]